MYAFVVCPARIYWNEMNILTKTGLCEKKKKEKKMGNRYHCQRNQWQAVVFSRSGPPRFLRPLT